jgi:hypothetical protein
MHLRLFTPEEKVIIEKVKRSKAIDPSVMFQSVTGARKEPGRKKRAFEMSM